MILFTKVMLANPSLIITSKHEISLCWNHFICNTSLLCSTTRTVQKEKQCSTAIAMITSLW